MRQMRALRDCVFGDGAGNMAIDCAILEAVAARVQPPTLRSMAGRPSAFRWVMASARGMWINWRLRGAVGV